MRWDIDTTPDAVDDDWRNSGMVSSFDECEGYMNVLTNTLKISFVALFFAVVFPMSAVSTQEPERKAPDLVLRSLAGRDLFEFYCASCHGRDGKGQGHVASALKTPPPDLTLLTQRNGGSFPTARVDGAIRGKNSKPTPAHGSSEMPVWGPIFKGLDNRNEVNEERINNLVKYIESIQAKAKAERRDTPTVSPITRPAR
jgi:mono/diheme cytochrome c family protein